MSASQNCCPACDAFIAALPSLGASTQIPRLDDINERLSKATGWRLVAVPRLIPEVPFFTLLAKRQFPVVDWIRQPKELDYIVEPDVFHDLFVYRFQHRQLPAKLLCD
jgi:phenylalanine-4-hydroxylase